MGRKARAGYPKQGERVCGRAEMIREASFSDPHASHVGAEVYVKAPEEKKVNRTPNGLSPSPTGITTIDRSSSSLVCKSYPRRRF